MTSYQIQMMQCGIVHNLRMICAVLFVILIILWIIERSINKCSPRVMQKNNAARRIIMRLGGEENADAVDYDDDVAGGCDCGDV